MAVRYIFAVALGALVTVSLFYLMQAVIHSDDNPLNEAPNGRLVDFVRLQEDQELIVKQRKPKPVTCECGSFPTLSGGPLVV